MHTRASVAVENVVTCTTIQSIVIVRSDRIVVSVVTDIGDAIAQEGL
jgi:hypothetical protein